jgi:hypothetical protein
MDLSEFYTGSMAAPDKGPNGTLVQSNRYAAPASISDLYGGMYSETGAAPTARSVQTTKVTPNYAEKNKNDVIANKPAPATQVAAPAYTDAANALDNSRLALTNNPFDTSAQRAIAQATKSGFTPVDPNTSLSYGMLLDLFTQPGYSGFDTQWSSTPAGPAPKGDAWATPGGGDLRIGPAGPAKAGTVTGNKGTAPAAAPTPASSLADLFGGPPAPGTYSSNLQHNPNFGPAPGVHPHLNQFGMFD